MRFPSRPVLAASVFAALAASGGTVLTMPDQSADAAEAPDLAASSGLLTPAPADVPTVAGPPVSGAQIAGLALAPARERAGALAAERAAAEAAAAKAAQDERARQAAAAREAEENDDDEDEPRDSGNDDWEEFRQELREACDDGRIRGQICRGA